MTDRQNIAVLGSTGSVGQSSLDVIERHPDRYRVFALSANTRVDKLHEQIHRLHPPLVVMCEEAAAAQLRTRLAADGITGTEVLSGAAALETVAAAGEIDTLVAGIVGAAGLRSTLAAARTGKRILLANKEALVMSGSLLLQACQASGALLLPLDSEHNAIFQALPDAWHDAAATARSRKQLGVESLILTASGGPFRSLTKKQLAVVSRQQALQHPTWDMGPKISIDSASLMNKGLEVIEASYLFGLPAAQIEVVIHPQSIVHSLVRYVDGSVLAQLGNPDMRTPIAHALAWPERVESGVDRLNLLECANLSFEAPDPDRFPCLRLAFEALQDGGIAPTVLNAANEIAVDCFLQNGVSFMQLPEVIERTLSATKPQTADELDTILMADKQARQQALKIAGELN